MMITNVINELGPDRRMQEIGGAMGSEEGLAQLGNALDFIISANLKTFESYRQHSEALRLIENYEIRIAGTIAHEMLPTETDLDVTDGLRHDVQPFVYSGLRFGHLLVKGLLNG